MKNTISGYEVLSNLFAERYVAGELGDVAQSEKTQRLSAKVKGFIDATVINKTAAKMLDALIVEYTVEIMLDAFAAGLRYGLDATAQGLDDRGQTE